MRFLPRVQALACRTSHACSSERPKSRVPTVESQARRPHGWREKNL